MDTTDKLGQGDKRLLSYSVRLLKTTFNHWLEDKAPQLGAALAYYTVFSLAPMLPTGFWCKLLKGSVSCDNCRDDGTDLGTRCVQGTAL